MHTWPHFDRNNAPSGLIVAYDTLIDAEARANLALSRFVEANQERNARELEYYTQLERWHQSRRVTTDGVAS